MISSIGFRTKASVFTASILILLLSTSCLDIATQIVLRRNGRVSARVEYILPDNTAAFGRGFGADEPWPLPLTEKEFRRLAARKDGVAFKHYRVRTLSEGGEMIRVKLEAEDFDSMAAFFGWQGNFQSDENGGSLEFDFPVAENFADLQSRNREVLESLVAEAVFELRVKPPQKPRTVEGGRTERGWAVFNLNFADLLNAESSPRWLLTW